MSKQSRTYNAVDAARKNADQCGNTDTAKTLLNTSILRGGKEIVKTRAIVAAIKDEFPGFDRPLFVKATNPDKYGIELVKRAREIAGTEPRRHEKKDSPCRLSCRTTKTLYAAVHRAHKRVGHRYIADTVIHLIKAGLEKEETK